MVSLEDLKPGLQLTGILPEQPVTVVDVNWHGSQAVTLIYKRADGQPSTRMLYRDDEQHLRLLEDVRRWPFDADGSLFRLAAEAYRIRLAHLFDPVLAVHTSLIEPLPHQITAVYEEMLNRRPLRFLLADDPGSGKTIMAGLLIKELMIRGDVKRCLIITPGGLTGQWQDELWFKFHLPFEILNRDSFDTAVSGNPFLEKDLLLVRLDQAARNDEWQARLRLSDWDLVIVDEAHKMSAAHWGGEVKRTQRYQLGELLGDITRHLLLMTATPHNGKEEDFRLFMRLLDRDRFEGRPHGEDDPTDAGDLMRRMQKENLRRFDGRPLFPERRAYTVNYPLSPGEKALYEAVTDYVREEFNRAEKLQSSRRGTVGFALTVLQRRLASSPEAIYQSLKRRRERLQARLAEVRQGPRDSVTTAMAYPDDPGPQYDESFWDDFDEAAAEEAEALEEQVLDQATAAVTAGELQAEIDILTGLERMAYEERHRGRDQKWLELAALLQDSEHMADDNGRRRKLVLFTEHRDTLRYLHEKITLLFGRSENIVIIDGSVSRDKRRAIEDSFRNDPTIHYLLATDAAGEGINLQRAHLMVNYDLPWNPNRLEQRFGRIHRIGQTEVCHLWNLVAGETREGYVYERLLRKLETESAALNGQVFDILGELFTEVPLRRLLVEAIRYGDEPARRALLETAVDNAVDREHVRRLLEAQSLASDSMDLSQIEEIRADMERFQALRLQPHHVQAFFLEAFSQLGGTITRREPGRFRISHVPATIRDAAKAMGGLPVLREYERITFDKSLINPPGQPLSQFVCPGHPLLDTVVDLVLDRYGHLLNSGAVLVDETDPGQEPRTLFFLEQRLRDAAQRVISQEVHFVEIDGSGVAGQGGFAPYLNYRPLDETEQLLVDALLATLGSGEEAAEQATTHAILALGPQHLARVRDRRDTLIAKTEQAVQKRLTAEINHWDRQARILRQQAAEGKPNARLNADLAQRRAEELERRRRARMAQLAQEKQIAADPPVIIGGALVVPLGLLLGERTPFDLVDTRITEAAAMQAVMQAEHNLGHQPRDVSGENLGYDIESFDPRSGHMRFIEVKGRRPGAQTVTITRGEIMCCINTPQQYILALVEVDHGQAGSPRYIRAPFHEEPDLSVTSVNYNLPALLERSEVPV